MTTIVLAVIVVALLAVVVGSSAIRVLREYERGVLFRLGRLIDLKGPGLVLMIPAIDRMVRVSLRTVTLNVPVQEVITRDNVPVKVTAVAYFRVVDANRAIVSVEDYYAATSQIAQTTLRSVLGKAELDSLLAERERLNEDLQKVIDQQTEPWGVKVSTVEIKDVEIPRDMQRAIARQAEAERERRAKIINAEAEFQASARLAEAADVISRNPTTLQLRYLQTLGDLGGESTSTVVFPVPIDLMRPFLAGGAVSESATASGEDAEASDTPALPGRNDMQSLIASWMSAQAEAQRADK
ncbi:slipin family protein [Rhodococcus spongiicola]|uniref:Slipin family protein n=1 Tax=Rhodococcus spongiicola TaxID=2487352 RepID=A0A3S3E6U9_9NOCA|nr:slipin family protein [Rhodococcus spongiicola]RVW06705.1 slipin family protein [Rhodococcus spongiicola]